MAFFSHATLRVTGNEEHKISDVFAYHKALKYFIQNSQIQHNPYNLDFEIIQIEHGFIFSAHVMNVNFF